MPHDALEPQTVIETMSRLVNRALACLAAGHTDLAVQLLTITADDADTYTATAVKDQQLSDAIADRARRRVTGYLDRHSDADHRRMADAAARLAALTEGLAGG